MAVDKNNENQTDKRIEDLKHINITVLSVISLIFVAFTLFTTLSLNSEKERLREYRDETERRLNDKIFDYEKKLNSFLNLPVKNAKISILTVDQEELNGKTIKGNFINENGINFLEIGLSIKNIGDGYTDPIYIKIYTIDPIRISKYKNSGVSGYMYEHTMAPEIGMEGFKGIIPPNMSTAVMIVQPLHDEHGNKIVNINQLSSMKGLVAPLRIEIYYGSGEVATSDFKVSI